MSNVRCVGLLWLLVIHALSLIWPAAAPAASGTTRQIIVYLVARGDDGKHGRKIGCNDSLVAVSRTVRASASPLRAAVQELLSIPADYTAGGEPLENFWKGSDLRLAKVSSVGTRATLYITGRLSVAGICDEPRITQQIEETARQFRSVSRVDVFINGVPLAEAIR